MNKPKARGRNDSHQMDYSKITDNIIVGSDFCIMSKCKDHAKEFKKLGVVSEINLTAETKEIPPDDMNIYAWLPVVDGYPPSPDQLDVGSSIVNQAVKDKNTVYIHCKNGHGRSPTMTASYFIRFKAMTAQKAIKLIEERRPEVHFEKKQRQALKDFEKRYRKK